MPAKLHLLPEAAEDVAATFAWYDGKRTGLGDEFLTCVEACLERIKRSPRLYAPVHETYRRALVRRFPFAVFYELCEGDVQLYAILHIARNPAAWRLRLP